MTTKRASNITTPVLYCIVLYCIVLYCIVLYCIVLYCIVLCCIVLYCLSKVRKISAVCSLYVLPSDPQTQALAWAEVGHLVWFSSLHGVAIVIHFP